jgi:hypothetical protein
MRKPFLLLGAVVAVVFTAAFVQPQTLNASPVDPVPGSVESVARDPAPEVPGMVDRFQAEKQRAQVVELPAQF